MTNTLRISRWLGAGLLAASGLLAQAQTIKPPEVLINEVEKHDILNVAGQDAALDRGTHRDDFVRVNLR